MSPVSVVAGYVLVAGLFVVGTSDDVRERWVGVALVAIGGLLAFFGSST